MPWADAETDGLAGMGFPVQHGAGRGFAGATEEDTLNNQGSEPTPEFKRGWDAAITAARQWHESQASQAMILSRRTRFPKNLERDAEVHRRAAEMMATLSPDGE